MLSGYINYIFAVILISYLSPSTEFVALAGPILKGEKPEGENAKDAQMDAYETINKEVAAAHHIDYIALRELFEDNEPTKGKGVEEQKGKLTIDGEHPLQQGSDIIERAFLDQALRWTDLWAPTVNKFTRYDQLSARNSVMDVPDSAVGAHSDATIITAGDITAEKAKIIKIETGQAQVEPMVDEAKATKAYVPVEGSEDKRHSAHHEEDREGKAKASSSLEAAKTEKEDKKSKKATKASLAQHAGTKEHGPYYEQKKAERAKKAA